MKVFDYATPDAAACGLVSDICTHLSQKKDGGTQASLALSGGGSAIHYLPRLFSAPLRWHQVTLTLTDERWLPVAATDSNEGQLQHFRRGSGATAARFVGFFRGDCSPLSVTPLIDKDLRPLLPLDVAVIGMGHDGHIASLFSNRDFQDGGQILVASQTPEGQPRISLSAATLASARRVCLFFGGQAKCSLFDEIMCGGKPHLPIARFTQESRENLHVYRYQPEEVCQ